MDSSTHSGRVRVVARIKGFGDQSSTTTPSISVRKVQSNSPGVNRVLISFAVDQSSTSTKPFSYEVDHCYDPEASNAAIFNEEIKPLISSVFEGKCATVFAYGARGSGKTYTIQGSENVPGFMTLSMSDFFSRAEEVGNCISISLYEVVQDRVFNLLNSKKPEISVLEGAHGKVVLKGLSKVVVKSMSDFQKSCSAILQRPLQKMPIETPQRSHTGMIINVLSSLEDPSLLGRMNLVDLAGYEDKRQSISGPNLVDISRINKSLYAVHNVFHALKSNDTHVPYRESKLTRMLQGSLGGDMNKILMITCMDPSSSEDTVKALSLASRSCNASSSKTKLDSTSRVRSLIKPTMTPASSCKPTASISSKTVKPTVTPTSSFKQTVPLSSKIVKTTMTPTSSFKQTAPLSSTIMITARSSFSASTKKQAKSSFHKTEKKSQDLKIQGRKLFKEQHSATATPKEETMPEKVIEVIESSRKQEVSSVEEKTSVNTSSIHQPVVIVTKPSSLALSTDEDILVNEAPVEYQNIVTLDIDILQADKENKNSSLEKGVSPPLSIRLQELSNSLKSLSTSTTLVIGSDPVGIDLVEPSTPISQPILTSNKKCQYSSVMSPWERLQIHSTGVKDSLVHSCLNFFNTASKEELMGLKGIGDVRSDYILQLRAESLEPFKSLVDLNEIGLSSKQINGMMRTLAGGLFD